MKKFALLLAFVCSTALYVGCAKPSDNGGASDDGAATTTTDDAGAADDSATE